MWWPSHPPAPIGCSKLLGFCSAPGKDIRIARREHTKHTAGRVVPQVKNMSDGNRVKGANFQLRQGEVLGLAGLVGAGRTELARLIFGADKRKSGELYLDGKKLQINQPKLAAAKRKEFTRTMIELAGMLPVLIIICILFAV